MAQEFHISVTPLGEDQYLVRIERVAPGVPLAEEQFRWPVENWLAQARQLMNDPLLGLLQGSAGGIEEIFFLPESNQRVQQSCLNLVALGQELYNALFQGSLRDSWMMAQAIAQNQRQVLRLRLGLKGNRLPRLPWEVLHAGDRPLATGTDVAFSRYQMSTGLLRPLHKLPTQPHQPLKILMVIAGPSDQESLELAQEASHLQEELKSRSPQEAPAIQLNILEQPGREQLTQALEQGQYQVFHYAGHSSLGDSGGDVYLVSNKTGLTETLNGDDLAGLLANNGVQLAVFNSCRGAYTATSDPLDNGKDRNLAEAVVKRGIPGVLAMAERIPDEVALTLTRLLYRNLNQGYPIDLSLSRARQGLISAYGSNQLYWALPVLYLHQEFDGFLTNVDQKSHNRTERLQLPELPESAVIAQAEADLFTPYPPLRGSDLLPSQGDMGADSRASLPGYEDQNFDQWMDDVGLQESEADDVPDFIKDLLHQNAGNPSNQSGLSDLGVENDSYSRLAQQGGQEQLNPPNYQANPIPRQASTPTVTSSSPMEITSPASKSVKPWWQLGATVPKLWLVWGIAGVLAIAGLGFGLLWHRQLRSQLVSSQLESTPPTPPQSPSPESGDLVNANTSQVTNIAITQFTQGNIDAGQKAVEKLLNDGALPQAKAALDAVPIAQLDSPVISFLRGRLAWQFIQAGNTNYDLDDARRYWETAVKGKSPLASYLNALGFAYYAEGDFERANNAWLDALTLIESTNTDQASVKQELMTTYAGLALGFWKSAQQQSPDKQKNLLNESLKLRQKVLREDLVNFQPEALSKNWLWSEQAIKDWQNLLAING